MMRTYKAILHGDQVQWIDIPPERTHPVQVHITVLEEAEPKLPFQVGRVMAEALAALVSRGTFSGITDPVAWQRQQRRERGLPDREW
jgi:hypothetical protein